MLLRASRRVSETTGAMSAGVLCSVMNSKHFAQSDRRQKQAGANSPLVYVNSRHASQAFLMLTHPSHRKNLARDGCPNILPGQSSLENAELSIYRTAHQNEITPATFVHTSPPWSPPSFISPLKGTTSHLPVSQPRLFFTVYLPGEEALPPC